MRRADLYQANLRQAIHSRGSQALKCSTNDAAAVSLQALKQLWVGAYNAIMSFDEAQPKEKATKMTHDRANILRRP
jgi:hypothetical protein